MAYLTLAGDKLFAVEEPIPAINWNISADTKNIMGMQCQKASGRFKGRDYEVWFAAELPYSNGPWKLGGLPGLIVEAYDTKKEVVFTMTEFKPVKDTIIAITIPSSVVKTTPKEYTQYRDALMKDRAANRGAAADSSFRGTLSVAAVAGGLSGPAQKPRQFNNPIEKEN
jgi:GLPGLI family protein